MEHLTPWRASDRGDQPGRSARRPARHFAHRFSSHNLYTFIGHTVFIEHMSLKKTYQVDG
jgi:hypothetical protein